MWEAVESMICPGYYTLCYRRLARDIYFSTWQKKFGMQLLRNIQKRKNAAQIFELK
jgi:hypothetical protein